MKKRFAVFRGLADCWGAHDHTWLMLGQHPTTMSFKALRTTPGTALLTEFLGDSGHYMASQSVPACVCVRARVLVFWLSSSPTGSSGRDSILMTLSDATHLSKAPVAQGLSPPFPS